MPNTQFALPRRKTTILIWSQKLLNADETKHHSHHSVTTFSRELKSILHIRA